MELNLLTESLIFVVSSSGRLINSRPIPSAALFTFNGTILVGADGRVNGNVRFY
jgi:hypothetical protein